MPTKEADYVLFNDSDYANHRSSSKENISWVQQHSLLVAEAKKPGEMPEILGQPQYYTVWTRAIAYFVTDGYSFQGCMYEPITSDYEVILCQVDELPEKEEITKLSFENLLQIKNRENQQIGEIENAIMEDISSELIATNIYTGESRALKPDEINLPSSYLDYMKKALGKDAEGLTDYQLTKRLGIPADLNAHSELSRTPILS